MLGIEDPLVREDVAVILTEDGYRVLSFENGLDILDYFGEILLQDGQQDMPDLVIAEAGLPGRNGLELLSDLRYGGWYTPFVLITRQDEGKLLEDARKMGVAAPYVMVLEVPYEIDALRELVFLLLEMAGPRGETPTRPRTAIA
jgi:DNA-binding response OmpR family regulator